MGFVDRVEPWFDAFIAIWGLDALAVGRQHCNACACLAKGTDYFGAVSWIGGGTCVAARF